MNTLSTSLPLAYVSATNGRNSAAFLALFSETAIVNDAGREFRGLDAIKAWSDREIFGAQVTLEVIDTSERDDVTVLTTKVDGNFDRTGLPNPVIISHRFKVADGKIVGLTCQLVDQRPV
jgi:hypothetical protein